MSYCDGAGAGYGEGGFGFGGFGGGMTIINYYLSLLTSQYQNSPNLKAFLALLLQPFIDAGTCICTLNSNFNIMTAVGVQLDILGQLIGVSRTLPFNPVVPSAITSSTVVTTGIPIAVNVNNTTYMAPGNGLIISDGGNTETVNIISVNPGVSFSAIFTHTHGSGLTVTGVPFSPILTDGDYRILLQAKILENQFNGQYMGTNTVLWQAYQTMFPGGHIYITDNQNMTASIFLVGGFTPLQQQMITNGLIIPRAEGVQFTYSFPTLPIFGFDNLNPSFIQGFDTGRWA